MDTVMTLKKSDFYFDLPEELIAQDPLEDRSSSRLLYLNKNASMLQISTIHFQPITLCSFRKVKEQ